ncbi:MAG: HepT-like ribonuclease domain-containing protein [Candidatus Hydrogenedentota bacterium]
MKLVENILRFKRHFQAAVQLIDKDIRDYLIYNTLAMECFQAVNALIEIGEYIVSKDKLGFPSSYSEVFGLLEQNKIITKDELGYFKRLIFLRNLIAHEYSKISEQELLELANLLEKVRDFVQRIHNLT